ncbi:hypothetical protein H6G33_14050 [Calothrix sp. FACHB-1219]|nr:hypothetical protein [Calothrix sp. FACHB-1219]MBD2218157.1 hypothetical protein [Calothrix sp. FACHB-1219]
MSLHQETSYVMRSLFLYARLSVVVWEISCVLTGKLVKIVRSLVLNSYSQGFFTRERVFNTG